MLKQLKLGNLDIPRAAALAPMAGLADRAFREICMAEGAVWCVGEMVSAKGLGYNSKKSAALLEIGPAERPCAVQLFGDDPRDLANAAIKAMEFEPDAVDINMGCPVPKVAGNGSGAALMKNLPLAAEIVRAVSDSVPVPVTVKIRKGWDDQTVNAVEAAVLFEQAGAAAVTVHGRTRMQMYTPPVDIDMIAQVKQAVSIPVIGNGDVDSPEAAAEMYERAGCDLVMVGRAALGQPWLFRRIRAFLDTGALVPDPSAEEQMEILLQHISLACAYKGEKRAMREARTHVAHYLKGFSGAAELRRKAGALETYSDLEALVTMRLEKQH